MLNFRTSANPSELSPLLIIRGPGTPLTDECVTGLGREAREAYKRW